MCNLTIRYKVMSFLDTLFGITRFVFGFWFVYLVQICICFLKIRLISIDCLVYHNKYIPVKIICPEIKLIFIQVNLVFKHVIFYIMTNMQSELKTYKDSRIYAKHILKVA